MSGSPLLRGAGGVSGEEAAKLKYTPLNPPSRGALSNAQAFTVRAKKDQHHNIQHQVKFICWHHHSGYPHHRFNERESPLERGLVQSAGWYSKSKERSGSITTFSIKSNSSSGTTTPGTPTTASMSGSPLLRWAGGV